METVNIPIEKQWAIPIADQVEFEREFVRRNPRADTIPDRNKWLGAEPPTQRGIEKFNEEMMEIDSAYTPHKRIEAILSEKTCKGCGKNFSARIARVSHERTCEKVLAMRSNNG